VQVKAASFAVAMALFCVFSITISTTAAPCLHSVFRGVQAAWPWHGPVAGAAGAVWTAHQAHLQQEAAQQEHAAQEAGENIGSSDSNCCCQLCKLLPIP
jgi:hypothetical protein